MPVKFHTRQYKSDVKLPHEVLHQVLAGMTGSCAPHRIALSPPLSGLHFPLNHEYLTLYPIYLAGSPGACVSHLELP